MKQQHGARNDTGDTLQRLSSRSRLRYRELPHYRSVRIGFPADATEDRAGAELRHAPLAIDDPLVRRSSKTQPHVALFWHEDEGDACQRLAHTMSSWSENSRSSSARSRSATVTPWRKAATLMRPRGASVTSIVSRAV